jgi:hypothetical protein
VFVLEVIVTKRGAAVNAVVLEFVAIDEEVEGISSPYRAGL